MTIFAFCAAASVGALARWGAGSALPRPFGTLAVNVVGAFLLALLAHRSVGGDVALGIGGLGALTTFSTLIDDLHDLWARDRFHAVGYVGATMVLGVGAAWAGLQFV